VSGKVHSQEVGCPPDVSRNSTAKGLTPEIVAGADTEVMTPLPLNAAFGGLPVIGLPGDVMPVFTGKLEDAATLTVLPRIAAMPGVMTPNRQPIWTWPESPRSVVLPSPFRSVNVGVKSSALSVPSPLVSISWQLIACASAMIWL
jgi:hypothetical protein